MSVGLSFSLIAAAFAHNDSLEQLNSQVAELLSPFQNQTTIAQLVFDKLELSAERTNNLALHALYRQVGQQNIFELKLDNLSYNYENELPKTTFKGSLSTDLTQIISQDQINDLVPGAAELIEQIVSDFVREYEDAVSVKGDVTSITQDAEGNYIGLTALFSMKIDLNKLPEYKSIEEVMITDAMVSMSLNVKTGFSLDAVLISNPKYLGFNQDERGLKEMLEQLLAGNEEALGAIEDLAMRIDELANDVLGKRLNLSTYFKFKK